MRKVSLAQMQLQLSKILSVVGWTCKCQRNWERKSIVLRSRELKCKKASWGRSYDKPEVVLWDLEFGWKKAGSQSNKITNAGGKIKEELHEIRLDRLFSIKKPAGIPSHTTLLCWVGSRKVISNNSENQMLQELGRDSTNWRLNLMQLEKRVEQQAINKVPEKGTRPLPLPHACHYPDEQTFRLQEK